MVATAHNMSDGREERVAKYKQDRRRELEARYGPRDAAQNVQRAASDKTENRSPGGNIRTTRASRLRTQANLAQSKSDVLRPKSGDFSSIESAHKEEDTGGARKWRGTNRCVTPSQQSSANSSPSNERKTKGKYVGNSRSLSPGSLSNVLGFKPTHKTPHGSPSSTCSTTGSTTSTKLGSLTGSSPGPLAGSTPGSHGSSNTSAQSSFPKSSQLVKKVNSKPSPGKGRTDSSYNVSVTVKQPAVSSITLLSLRDNKSPYKDRPTSLPVKQTSSPVRRSSSPVRRSSSPVRRSSSPVRRSSSPVRRSSSPVRRSSSPVKDKRTSSSPVRDRRSSSPSMVRSLLPLRQHSINSLQNSDRNIEKFTESQSKYNEIVRSDDKSPFTSSYSSVSPIYSPVHAKSNFLDSPVKTNQIREPFSLASFDSQQKSDDESGVIDSPLTPVKELINSPIYSPVKSSSPQPSPVRHPASILKKSSIDESSSQPISILKRKSSRDEESSCTSPVRWSDAEKPRATVVLPNTALLNTSSISAHSSLALSRGILKKHRSLDEPHALIIESAVNQQNGNDEMKPILKGEGRRCSLEELKRNQSPEGHPQGILKRKTSTGNPSEESVVFDEHPHGILKRKGSSASSTPPSPVKDCFDNKPILKKKLSTEEPPELFFESHHPPRPILKKKSLEEEEYEVKPILKTKYEDWKDIKPILKQDKVVLRSNSVRSSYQNRRSLDANFVYNRSLSPDTERPLSIAERILHLESNIDQELTTLSGRSSRMDDGDVDGESNGCSLQRSGSVSERASMWNKLQNQSTQPPPPAPARVCKGRAARSDASRFNTQPVTLGEVEQARLNNLNQQQQLDCVDEEEPSRLSLAERVRLFSNSCGGEKPVASKSQLPPLPRRAQPIAHSATSSIVSGLLKNLRDKDKAGSGSSILSPPKSDYSSDEDEAASTDSSDTESAPSLSTSPLRSKFTIGCGMVGGGGVVVRRCATEPMDRISQEESKDGCDESDTAPVITIAERLAALQRSGSTDWRKRVRPQDNGEANGGVADRLGKLESATQGWKARVEAKDNIRFTVKGKMGSVPSSPVTLLPPMVRSQPQPHVFAPQGLESLSVPVSPDVANDNVLGFIKRSASAPGTDHLKRILNGGSNVETPGPIVTVPEVCDEDFHSFFPDYTPQTNKLDTQDIDFEHISTNSSRLLVSARKVRVQRKHHSANPLRALAQRNDLTTEYVEVRSGIAEKERIRLNIDKLSKANPGLAVEALAGLASKEELTSVVLRRSAETGPVKQVAQWSHPLLLRTKGRRHPITSIVTPHYTSINQGDAFTLVTSNQVFCWTGEYCNVIEKSRCSEVSSEIQNRRDMGCLSASKVFNLDGTLNSPHHNTFWNILKLPQDRLDSYKGEEAGHPDEDELYESAVSQSYRVYELSDMKLIPVEQAWARHPRIQVLSSSKVMVFDFVTEVFCWCGKGSSTSERKQGLKLATELSKEPSWSQCGIQWLDDEIAANKPSVYSVTQHMEPILFREKFTDWPDFNRNNISSKGEFTNNNSSGDNVKSCDIKSMLEWSLPQPDLVLENSHLGRANKYFDIETRRFYKVSTQSVRIWKIEDYAPVEVEEEEYGHFSDSHSYIIQWKYTLTVTGRELSGEPSKHLALGRDRTCFWTWQGKHAGLEAGTASLIAVGMQQGAPQVTVKEGLEPPSLQSLMPTPALVIHSEKLTKFPKLYLIEPGQDPSGDESPLIRQIACDDTNLRSAASLLYIPRATSPTVYVWHGCSTKPYYRSVCKDAVCKVLEKPSPKFKLTEDRIEISEIIEGNEPKEFFNGVVLRKGYCSEYYTKSDNSTEREVRLKLFELSVVKGVYTAVPVPPQRFNPENQFSETYRYVYSQEELYNTTSQCVVMDASPGSMWLWLKSSSPVPSTQALATCLAYAQAKDVDAQHVYVTCQGSEPSEFRALFAWWSEDLSWERGQGWSRQESRLCTDMMSDS